VSFIDGNRDEFGVEPISKVLQVVPSTCYSAKSRPLLARAIRDVVTTVAVMTVWKADYSVYGVHKMWKALQCAGEDIGRDQFARIMSDLGIAALSSGREGVHYPPR
jgi:putative transposase